MATLGIDIGCISVKAALVANPGEAEAISRLAREAEGDGFFASPAELTGLSPTETAPPLLVTTYRRSKGSPGQSALALLEGLRGRVPAGLITGIRMTGTGSRVVAAQLGLTFENEFKAIARAMGALYPEARYVFEMGGETSKFIELDVDGETGRTGITDYQTNGDCAAGTGSFMDQQANRLLYEIENVGDIVLQAGKAATVAGRCSVFAKSDMIHAQQKGYQPPEVLKGLCDAVVRNFRGAIARGKTIDGIVAFVGGVAANKGAAQAMREAFELPEERFFVPRYYAWMGAIGAALLEQDRQTETAATAGSGEQVTDPLSGASFSTDTLQRARGDGFPTGEPLSMDRVILLRDRIHPYQWPAATEHGGRVDAYLGVDIGSVSTNLVVLDAEGNLIKEI